MKRENLEEFAEIMNYRIIRKGTKFQLKDKRGAVMFAFSKDLRPRRWRYPQEINVFNKYKSDKGL